MLGDESLLGRSDDVGDEVAVEMGLKGRQAERKRSCWVR